MKDQGEMKRSVTKVAKASLLLVAQKRPWRRSLGEGEGEEEEEKQQFSIKHAFWTVDIYFAMQCNDLGLIHSLEVALHSGRPWKCKGFE